MRASPPSETNRLHLQAGPIDLVIQAWGTTQAIHRAYQAATELFPDILPTLCQELPLLRTPLPSPPARHPIAQSMQAACTPYTPLFITPMAAVAGAVADAVLQAMTQAAPLDKAYVNNRGDIALHLTPGQTLDCGLVTTLKNPKIDAALTLTHRNPTRGIATSGQACKGQGGRSFSLGIADSVTILAQTAAGADAAATIVANAVDLPGHPAITRRPATDLDPASDLGPRPITWHVPPLTRSEIETALANGRQMAEILHRQGLIHGAILALQGHLLTHLPARPQ